MLSHIFRYDFWDTDKLADQLVAISTSKALKYELTQNVKHEYTKISWESVALQCMNMYKQVAGRAIV